MSRVTLVTGPPCAGKSTWVAEHAGPSALVVCWDTIATGIGASTHPTPGYLDSAIQAAYDRLLAQVPTATEAWIIRCLPDPAERAEWATRLGAEVVVLCPPREVLAHRALARRQPGRTMRYVDYWIARNPTAVDSGVIAL